jgi:hypothetical protein
MTHWRRRGDLVSVVLPSELAWVLDLLGFNWPKIDTATLEDYGLSGRELHHPEVAP